MAEKHPDAHEGNEHHEHHEHAGKEPSHSEARTVPPVLITILLVLAVLISGYNQMAINEISAKYASGGLGSASVASTQTSAPALTGDPTQDAIKLVIPTGTPPVYGAELGVSFDDPIKSLAVLQALDPTYGKNKITLDAEQTKRYVKVGSLIACEYCCGAKTLVFGDGRAACGCAHSQAMRGLAAYIITKHPNDMTDDQLLREMARWKALFFPKQMIQKFETQRAAGQFSTADMAAIMMGIDTKALGMGTQATAAPTSVASLPNMVGGC